MAKFNQKVDQLRRSLDDIIIYLENIGKCNQKIKIVRKQLDNVDPFIRIDSAITAESIVIQNKLLNMH